jgi:hypothetical protein
MSPRHPATTTERRTGDLVDAPFLDDTERAEASWLIARETDVAAQALSPAIARDYERLEHLLDSLPAGRRDERWHDEVLRLARSSAAAPQPWWRRPFVRWSLGGGALAAAAVAVVLLLVQPPELEIAIHRGTRSRDTGDVVVGDRLQVTARPRHGGGDLRVFRANDALVARCPGGPGCVSSTEPYAIDIPLEQPVPYQVILVVGDQRALHALPETPMAAYVNAARAASARVVLLPPVDVY